MIHSSPKSSTLVSVGFVIVIILGIDGWILYGLLSNPSEYFILKLVLAPSLIVIAIIVASKSYFTAVHVSLGENKIIYWHLVGTRTKVKFSEISYWKEDVVKRKSSEFRQLMIVLKSGKKLKLSNHENTEYTQAVNYLNKKLSKLKKQ